MHGRGSNDKRAMLYSIVLHGAVLSLAWLSTRNQPPVVEFLSFEIEMVSPPAAVQAEERTPPREELVVERPEPEPEPTPPEPEPDAPVMEPERPPEPEPQPEPRREPEPEPVSPEPSPEPTPATAPEPPPETPPTTSGEAISVRLEGLRRDYPVYYENIIRQIQRCFRWQGTPSLVTKVYFIIRSNGSVTDLEFITRSGNTAFDFEAMGAIDCAGQGRFGPLPEDLPYETLPVEFEFRPIR